MNNLFTLISENGGIVVHAIDSTAIVAEMERLHTTSATASAALGRLLTASAIMGGLLKSDHETLSLTVKGGGPVGTLLAISDSKGNVRGSIGNPLADLPLNPDTGKLNVGGIVGAQGNLSVIRDLGMGEPYIGQVSLVSGEIAEDVTRYYAISEQIPTVCALGVLVGPDLTIQAAGGYLLQLMPGATDQEISLVERNIAKMDAVTSLLDAGVGPVEIAQKTLSGFNPQVLDSKTVRYRCNCSRDKMTRALLSMGREELRSLADDMPETELVCSYCNEKYLFASAELRVLSG